MRDFTVITYTRLLRTILEAGYRFVPFAEYCDLKDFTAKTPRHEEDIYSQLPGAPAVKEKFVILRHDVDARPQNSLAFARLEHALGIRGTYYFRMVPGSYDEGIIRGIAGLGHEIGYHYETMAQIGNRYSVIGSRCSAFGNWLLNIGYWLFGGQRVPQRRQGIKNNDQYSVSGNRSVKDEQMVDDAFELFAENLEKLRRIVSVTTICMHGSPLSHCNNRDIWKKYDYHIVGILGEASLDVDFSKVAYFTDTGRRWDGYKVSVRDKVGLGEEGTDPPSQMLQRTRGLRDLEIKRRRDEGTDPPSQMLRRTRGLRDLESEGLGDLENEGTGERRNELNDLSDSEAGKRYAITNQKSQISSMPHPNLISPLPPALCPKPQYRHTRDLISALQNGNFPAQAMITLHPQRWNDTWLPWLQELLWQNIKNQVKRIMIRTNKYRKN